jgi:hypothetical protein
MATHVVEQKVISKMHKLAVTELFRQGQIYLVVAQQLSTVILMFVVVVKFH